MVSKSIELSLMEKAYDFDNEATNPYFSLDHSEWPQIYENYLGIKQQLIFEAFHGGRK